MKSNYLLLLLSTFLGCFCLAMPATQAADLEAIEPNSALPSRAVSDSMAQVLESPSNRAAESSVILESPSSRATSGRNLDNSIQQVNNGIDQRAEERRAQAAALRQQNVEKQQEWQQAQAAQREARQAAEQQRLAQEQEAARRQQIAQQREAARQRQLAAQRQASQRRQPQTSQPQPVVQPRETIVAQASPEPQPEPQSQSAKAIELADVSFACDPGDTAPSTVIQLKDQTSHSVILWSSDFFAKAGYDPQVRCEQVSARFEAYVKQSSALYLTTGTINQQPVICITGQETGGCGTGVSVDHQGLLFTLKPDSDGKETLEQLVAVLQSESETAQEPLRE